MDVFVGNGFGPQRSAGVDNRYRVLVAALTESESNYHTTIGLKYNVNTGDVTLTNSAKITILYLKNNDTRDIVIDSLIYNLGTSTGGTGDVLIDVIRNPTTGDIVTNAVPVPIGLGIEANLNYGSSNTLKCDVYKGTFGDTPVTDGLANVKTRNPATSGRILLSPGGGVILPNGSSIAINYTPPTGNTSQVVQFALNVYVKEVT